MVVGYGGMVLFIGIFLLCVVVYLVSFLKKKKKMVKCAFSMSGLTPKYGKETNS